MTSPDVRLVTLAVVAALDGIEINGAGVPVHQVAVPDDTTLPYLIVQPSAGGVLDGTLGQPDIDGDLIVLVTAVAQRREGGMGAQQALWLQQQARDRLLGTGIDPDGWAVMRCRLDVPGGVTEDFDPSPHRFFTVDRFALSITPDQITT